jgi:hypothetical protein
MYGRGKGKSKSSIPYKKKAPRWMTVESGALVNQIEALAKKGNLKNIYRIKTITNWCYFKR